MKETYVVIKRLPDAEVGTEVKWDEEENVYYYKKSVCTSPNDISILKEEQVIEFPEFFCKTIEYAEYNISL